MDYHILDHISDAFVIVDLKTATVKYLNAQAKVLLKVPSKRTVKVSQFFENENQWCEFRNSAMDFFSKSKKESHFALAHSIRTYDNTCFLAIIKCGYTDDTKETVYLTFCNINNAITDEIDFRTFTEMALAGFAVILFDEFLTIKYANKTFYKIFEIDAEQYNCMHSFLKNVYSEDKEKVVMEYKKQLENKEYINLEYRITTKDNKLKWIKFEGTYVKHTSGFDEIYCIVSEISERKELLEKLVSERHFYSIAKDTSEDIVFQFTLHNDHMEQYGKAVAQFPIPSTTENFPNITINKGVVTEEDIPIFLQLFKNIREGIIEPLEFRLVNIKNEIAWYRVEYKLSFDNDSPIQASGKTFNIQRRKLLEETASTDPLTKCLNKKSIEEIVTLILESSISDDQHAFLIIDVDNFKNVNDSLGHHFGDLVLAEISKKLRKSFRGSDYVGRIGGDEFVIFMKNISDLSVLIKKSNSVIEIFQNVYFKENNNYKISASIGIARFPIDGRSYEDLYKKADIALYNSKDNGKNCYSLYSEDLTKVAMRNITPLGNVESTARLLNEQYNDKTISMVFDLLYESNDISVSINVILSLIGTQFEIDRCYIFETEDHGEHYSNTFEWCNTNIISEIDSLQNLHNSTFDDIFPRANQNGIFYCNDLTELASYPIFNIMDKQQIKSLLFSVVKKNDSVNLLMGFDDCTKTRIWTGKEISILVYVSKVLAIFLAREKDLRILTDTNKKCEDILANTHTIVYVINKTTHEILYANKKASEVIGSITIGSICYSHIRGYSDVCPDCPLKKLNADCKVFTCEIMNKKFNVSTLTTAAAIKWDNKIDAGIIYSVDITKCKKLCHGED